MMLEVITPATGEGVAGSVPGWFATSDANLDSFAHILIRDGYRVNLGSAAVIPVSWQYVEGRLVALRPDPGRAQAGRPAVWCACSEGAPSVVPWSACPWAGSAAIAPNTYR